MDNLKISAAQFENRSGDKEFNLSRIESLAGEALGRILMLYSIMNARLRLLFARLYQGRLECRPLGPIPGGPYH